MTEFRKARVAVSLMAMVALAIAGQARADANDLQIFQLGTPGSGSNDPATERFRMLANELGVAMAGPTLEPANTLGIDGFDFAFETSFVLINPSTQIGGQSYWATTNLPPNVLVIPQLHFRKGLPYSLELGGRVSIIPNSSMYVGGAEAKWGILEGFRYAPDVSARFSMSRLFGQNDFDVTTGGLDFTMGKQFGLAGLVSLSPYVGYALTGIDSSSRTFWASSTTSQTDYQQNPIANQAIFAEQKWSDNLYDRFYVGLQVTSYVLSLNAEYSYSRPSSFSGTAFPVNPGISQVGLRIALTL